MKSSLIIFDIDGTVFDSQHNILAAFQAAFEEVNLPQLHHTQITRTIGLSPEEAVKEMLPNTSDEKRQNVVRAFRKQSQIQASGTPFFKGMRGLIGALSEIKRVKLGIATGKLRRGLDPLLQSSGLSECFSIRQTPDIYPSKPNPEMLLAAMRDYEFSSSQVVMIGDTSFDIEMAKRANIRSIGVTWGYHQQELLNAKPTAIANRPVEIYDIIKKWNLI